MSEIFSANAVTLFPDVIEDGSGAPIGSDIDSDDVEVDRILCLNIGQTTPRPHLMVCLSESSLG